MPRLPRPTTSSALLALALLGAAAVPAGAQQDVTASKRLWATVNVCDTAQSPDTVGVRASMPGTGSSRQRMFMRFQLEYRAGEAWSLVGESADSGFVGLGSAVYVARRTGRSFVVPAPESGAYRLRGRVTFQWRRGDRVVREVVRRTEAGHPTGASEPEGFSAAACSVAG